MMHVQGAAVSVSVKLFRGQLETVFGVNQVVRIMKFMESRMALLILCCSFSQQLLQLYWRLTSMRQLRAHVCSGFFCIVCFFTSLDFFFPCFLFHVIVFFFLSALSISFSVHSLVLCPA